jgi:hypothetical protein
MGVPVTGLTITSVRQADIKIPMFDPSYTVDIASAANVVFAPMSLWPLLVMPRLDVNGNLVYQQNYTISPFGSGRTIINSANSGLATNVNNVSGNLRWSDLLFSLTSSKNTNNYRGYTVNPCVTGIGNLVSFLVGGSMKAFLDQDGSSSLGQAIMIATKANTLVAHMAFCSLITSINGNGPVAATRFDPLALNGFKPQLISNTVWNLLSSGGLNAQSTPVTSVPALGGTSTLDEMLTWHMWNTTADVLYVGAFDYDSPLVQHAASILQFDNATINTAMIGQANSFQSTVFGHLVYNSSSTKIIPGQSDNIVLISPDGTEYSVIRLVPMSAATALYVGSGLGIAGFKIDPLGYAYYEKTSSANNAKVFANSYALNIPWAPVTPPLLNTPSFAIPGLCGCVPTGGYYG